MTVAHLSEPVQSHVHSGGRRTMIARLGQRVENEILGLPSGIMDQLVSASAVAGHAPPRDH